ncbi:MAG: sulfotransferase [Thermoplasmata archaeon]
MNEETIVIVSGLPRCGTSMMMNMLERGGIEPLTDNVRTANVDNPKGYYEFERVKKLPDDTDWLPQAKGKTVKVLAELIKHLPEGYKYKVIFMKRNLKEVIESQKKMLKRRGEDPDGVSDEELRNMFIKYLKVLEREIDDHPDMDVIYVSYNDMIETPELEVDRINDFLSGGLDTDEMLSTIDKNLYRNRALE